MNLDRQELAQITQKSRAFLRQQKYQAAENLLKSSLSRYKNPPHLHNLLGLVYHKQSKFPEALKQFRKAHLGNPEYLEAILNLSITLCDLGCYDEAREVYKQLRKHPATAEAKENPALNGRLANTHVQVAEAYLQIGKLNEAVHEFRKALKIYQFMPDVQLQLAKCLMKLAQDDLAKKELVDLERNFPSYAPAKIYLGLLLYKQGQNHLAKNAWERAHSNSPEDPTARAYMKLAKDWPSDPPL
ncbi:MAG: tetratricopeptide repeat protein [Oligoflexales bacterium]